MTNDELRPFLVGYGKIDSCESEKKVGILLGANNGRRPIDGVVVRE